MFFPSGVYEVCQFLLLIMNYIIVIVAIAGFAIVDAYNDTQCHLSCSDKACNLMAASLDTIGQKNEGLDLVLKYLGEIPLYAATSCQQIAKLKPQAESGRYWIQVSNQPAQIFCSMNNTDCGGGVWTRVANVDMTIPSHKCPSGLETITSPKRSCRKRVDTGTSRTWFSNYQIPYSKVCGKLIGYQKSSPDAFMAYHNNRALTIDGCYADGALLSYDYSPRKHIWTFTAMQDESAKNRFYGCRCGSNAFDGSIPLFVKDDFFCETGVNRGSRHIRGQYHVENPLWDGKGCGTFPSGCEGTRSPWFVKEYSFSINSQIELRLCTDEPRSDEDVVVEQIYIYIQ